MNLSKILAILGIVFVTLKLTDHIDWSWWLVLLPFYLWFLNFMVGIILLTLEIRR